MGSQGKKGGVWVLVIPVSVQAAVCFRFGRSVPDKVDLFRNSSSVLSENKANCRRPNSGEQATSGNNGFMAAWALVGHVGDACLPLGSDQQGQ